MITKDITLCGKQVTLAYNFGAEIDYKKRTEEDIIEYVKEAVSKIKENEDPDKEKTIFAIMACMVAYYDSIEQKEPLNLKDLKYNLASEEMGTAIVTIISMRMDFYHIPKGEPEEEYKGEEDSEKN